MPMSLQRNLGRFPLGHGRNIGLNGLLSFSPLLLRLTEGQTRGSPQCRHIQKRRPVADAIHKWELELDITRAEGKPEAVMSLPMLIFLYSPWKYLSNKINMCKLKLLWDFEFSEAKFVENSKQAAIVITDIIRKQNVDQISSCTTPIGFKQIQLDMLGTNPDRRLNLMRFERKHLQRAIPLKAQMLRHYEHKFAFIDMIFVALRRTSDFKSHMERNEVERLIKERQIKQAQGATQVEEPEPHPFVFAEIFVRFRRDYSVKPTGAVQAPGGRCHGHWLVSTFKILQFDVLDHHPDYQLEKSRELLKQPN